ncbi:MAG: porin family protein, partial [Prevotella sp.]|nr:porin family protein [Prevotella sp.]
MVALALTTLTLSAQEDSKITVKAGVGLSSVVGSDADTKTTFAYKIGASYDLGLSENFSIIPSIEFTTKGFKSDIIDGNISMSYLQIPIFAAYKVPISDNMKLAIKAGPYIGYGLFGSDIEWYSGGKTNVFDSDGGYDRLDVGAIAGISLDFDRYMIGLEYSRGLKKLDSDYSQFNQAFGVVFGYKF